MSDAVVPPPQYEALSRSLEVLSSPVRLTLLHCLRQPVPLHQIRVASPSDGGKAKPISRQAVRWHLDQMLEAGLVKKLPGEGRSHLYVIDHEQVFALVDEMRNLSKLRPSHPEVHDPTETLTGDDPGLPARDTGPRLLLVYGRDDGTAFSLVGTDGATWTVGRSADADIQLDYDPYLSATTCEVQRHGDGHRVRDLGSRNGTWLNGRPVPEDGWSDLRAGDVLQVGRSQLVYQT